MGIGQARKSLWIETIRRRVIASHRSGQARKSLWIETGNKQALASEDVWSGS